MCQPTKVKQMRNFVIKPETLQMKLFFNPNLKDVWIEGSASKFEDCVDTEHFFAV